MRRALLGLPVFRGLAKIREQSEQWLRDHSETIPHESLEGITPVA